jgi:RNA polymerase II elongation factor ELL
MRKAVTHLLAMKPLAREEISAKTKIPKEDVEDILSKIGKADGAGGKWGLVDRAYKDLDVWKFGYSTQEDRQAAVENAVRAYDRQRIGKEEAIWQKLLPEEKRNQGIYLSKLHIGGATSTGSGRGSGSPSDGINEDNGNGAVNGIGNGNGKAGGSTPRLGAGTPKIGTGKSDLMKKLAKKPKQRALEEAKEKKRKEREAAVAAAAAASDREGKPPPRKRVKVAGTKANANPKVKSAELVYSSSDESETGEIKESSGSTATGTATATGTSTGAGTGTGSSSSSQPKGNTKPPPLERKPAAAAAKAKTKPPPSTAAAPAAKARPVPASTRTAAATAAAAATKARTANVGKSTPRASHAAPASSRNQLSPSKPDHKPKAPSPLGPSRARVTSDVSERGALGSQRARQDSGGAETPKGLGISNVNGVRKRPETNVTSKSVGSGRTNGEARKPNAAKPSRVANGTSTSTPRASLANGGTQKVENGLKRKHLDSPIPTQENGIKHRKTDSSSTHSQRSQQSNGAGHSMDGLQRSLSSDSARSVELDYEVGVRKAEEFHEKYYPEYTRLYDQQAAMEKRGEKVPREEREKLWRLHRQLEKMKKEIREASLKEHD